MFTEINGNSIPKWEQNIELLDSLISLNINLNLTTEMMNRNIKFKNYSELRVEELGFLKQAILWNTMNYDFKMDSLNREMQKIIDELN